MDLASVLGIGLAFALFTTLSGLVIAYLARNRLKKTLAGIIDDYVGVLLADVGENPDKYVALLAPLLDKLTDKTFGSQRQGGPKSVKLFGIPIPGEVVQGVIGQFLQGFLKKGKEETVSAILG